MNRIMVVGAGTMGAGIAQVFAQAGNQVVLNDLEQNVIDNGIAKIEKNLNRMVKKEKISEEEKTEILSRIIGSTELKDGYDADLVVEAILENIEIKKSVFKKLDEICEAKTILASNTSSISITAIASATNRGDQVIGMHFFNPVPVMQLVELIRGVSTSDETYETARSTVEAIPKKPIAVNEAPGFAVNRILVPMINEAVFLLMEGVCSAEDIDKAMKLGANHPIGPLALADMIGLDVCLAVVEVLYEEFGDSKYRPCPLLKKMVRGGMLGMKSGQGFYKY